jgi:hypothetical protein
MVANSKNVKYPKVKVGRPSAPTVITKKAESFTLLVISEP